VSVAQPASISDPRMPIPYQVNRLVANIGPASIAAHGRAILAARSSGYLICGGANRLRGPYGLADTILMCKS
jgi:hypothetical protein